MPRMVRSPEDFFLRTDCQALLALLEFGDEYDDVIKIMSGWFNTDRVNKRRYSDDELSFSAYMTSQSYSDDDGDGFADIDYILWGTRRQSAGMNSRSISAFLALGMKDEAIQTAEWLINVMWDEEEGRFDAIYDFGAGTSLSLEESGDIGCVNASIASGLLTVYEATGDRKYLDYATAALDWVIEHETAFEITPCGSPRAFLHETPHVWHSARHQRGRRLVSCHLGPCLAMKYPGSGPDLCCYLLRPLPCCD